MIKNSFFEAKKEFFSNYFRKGRHKESQGRQEIAQGHHCCQYFLVFLHKEIH